MSAVLEARNLRLLAWIAFYAVVLIGGRIGNYIAQWQYASVWLGGALLCLVWLLTISLKRTGPAAQSGARRLSQALETAGHFAPLFILLAAGPGLLSASGTAVPPPEGTLAAIARARGFATPSDEPAGIEQPSRTGAKYTESSLIEIYFKPQSSSGRSVELVAMLHKLSGDRDKWLPEAYWPDGIETVGYRYVINCCAADAMPLSIALQGISAQASAGMAQDSWVKLRGTVINLDAAADTPRLMLRVDEFEPCPVPQEPYLSLRPRRD